MTKQSHEPAPEPVKAQEFDTTTPAQPTPIRRFTLNDLPRYEANLFPHLKKLFPHIHERMYGGWLRGCMQDNSCFFVCGNATVALAQITHDPLDPIPVVQTVFILGDPKEYKGLMDEIIRWKNDLGASEVRHFSDNIPSFEKSVGRTSERRTIMVFK